MQALGKNNGLNKQKQELIEKENTDVNKYMCGRERRTRRGKNCALKKGYKLFKHVSNYFCPVTLAHMKVMF